MENYFISQTIYAENLQKKNTDNCIFIKVYNTIKIMQHETKTKIVRDCKRHLLQNIIDNKDVINRWREKLELIFI